MSLVGWPPESWAPCHSPGCCLNNLCIILRRTSRALYCAFSFLFDLSKSCKLKRWTFANIYIYSDIYTQTAWRPVLFNSKNEKSLNHHLDRYSKIKTCIIGFKWVNHNLSLQASPSEERDLHLPRRNPISILKSGPASKHKCVASRSIYSRCILTDDASGSGTPSSGGSAAHDKPTEAYRWWRWRH